MLNLECFKRSNDLRGERNALASSSVIGVNIDMESLQVQVAQAVHILNHDTQSVNRVAANQWLVQFQNTDAAWEVATTILAMDSSPTIDFEVELFAGQVLKRKVCITFFLFYPILLNLKYVTQCIHSIL